MKHDILMSHYPCYDNLINESEVIIMEYEAALQKLFRDIGNSGIMVLSTCSGDRVTSRPMSVVVIDGRFYFQTDETYLKYRQLTDNPNVSLSVKNYSIEGIARDIGKPSENAEFMSAMTTHFPSAVSRWSALPSERVIEVSPTLIRSWIYENYVPFTEHFDFTKQIYIREKML